MKDLVIKALTNDMEADHQDLQLAHTLRDQDSVEAITQRLVVMANQLKGLKADELSPEFVMAYHSWEIVDGHVIDADNPEVVVA